MAEEEAGFTFVDKRRTQAAAPTEPAPKPVSVAEPVAAVDMPDDDLDAPTGAEMGQGAAPTTYDLIGYCLNLLTSQAWQKLGLLADPQTGEANPDLAEAKLAIDTVGDLAARLETAPPEIVPAEMRQELRTLLNDLRLNYVSQRGPTA